MKMVKSLLLGSAAGLVAMAGAQAADLPVKAKPVQYVKICSLYGVGFYYIPGTDMCLKVGGWVRSEWGEGANGSLTWGPFAGNGQSRNTNNIDGRARGYITADARNQTAYGTVRAYIAVGVSENDVGLNTQANVFSANRAFIQWAGFTFGRAQSFYDFYSVPATSYWGIFPASDTGDPGWLVAAYTAQFGNGFSATIAAEQRRVTQIIGVDGAPGTAAILPSTIAPGNFGSSVAGNSNTFAAVFPTGGLYGGMQVPDFVGNLRLDQAWGSVQVMAAWHDVNSIYYDGSAVNGVGGTASGNPSDKSGWAIGGGLKLNADMIAKGDYLQAQVNYAEGALRYIFMTPDSNWGKVNGNSLGYGVLSDAVFGSAAGFSTLGATGLDLTTGWNVNAAYEHFWNSQWRTSVYGGYAAVSYNTEANANLCIVENAATGVGGTTAVATPGCDNDWSTWWVGSRTQWNVTSDFYMGVDVMYSKLNSASAPNGLVPTTNIKSATNSCGPACTIEDPDNWAFRFRVHKDFYP